MKPRFYVNNPRGHQWALDEEDGEVDIFAYEIGHHNGPRCVKCGFQFCHHCKDEIPKCKGAHND